MRWMRLMALGLVCGCSGGNGNPDSGTDADGGFDGGDEEQEFALVIPAGTQACTIDPVMTDDLASSFDTKGRVTFREGTVELPADQDSFTRDWIEELRAGPDGSVAVPDGPGTFTLTRQGANYYYLYSQGYQLDGQPITLSFGVSFEPGEKEVSIGEETLSRGRFENFEVEMSSGWRGNFNTCLYTFFHCTIREFEIEGGDRLKLEHCNYCPGDMICKSDPGVMTRLLFTSGGQERLVEDHFRMAHSMRHHNWGSDFLVRFADPLGPVSGLYLGSDSYPDYSNFSEINYLDESLGLIETKAILQQEIKPGW